MLFHARFLLLIHVTGGKYLQIKENSSCLFLRYFSGVCAGGTLGVIVRGGGGRGRVTLGGNCGTGVQASMSKPTPYIYLTFKKRDPFIYLIVRNVDLYIYCPLIFYSHLLLIQQLIH